MDANSALPNPLPELAVPEIPVDDLPPIGSQPLDYPVEAPPIPAVPPPSAKTIGKPVLLAILIFLVAASGIAAYFLSGLRTTVPQRAESVCNYADNPNHPCNNHAPNSSWCEGNVRKGCDQACNFLQAAPGETGNPAFSNPWCEGNREMTCNGVATATGNACGANNNCDAMITYEGASGGGGIDCAQGVGASVKMKACVAAGCPAKSITYKRMSKQCPGSGSANCSGTCGETPTDVALDIPASGCAEVEVTCNVPDNCGSCQADINTYGVRRWETSGCNQPTPTQGVVPACTMTIQNRQCITGQTQVTLGGFPTNATGMKFWNDGDAEPSTYEAFAATKTAWTLKGPGWRVWARFQNGAGGSPYCSDQLEACGVTPTVPPPTATGQPAACLRLTVSKIGGGEVTGLRVGDQIRAEMTYQGVVQDVVIVLKKLEGGVWVEKEVGRADFNWDGSGTQLTRDFTIREGGAYRVLGFVKVNNTWR